MNDRSAKKEGYNERLFSGGVRRWLHEARFRWLRSKSKALKPNLRIIELGCFDCRSLDYMPANFQTYVGFDADWEGGLAEARRKFAESRVILKPCRDPKDFAVSEEFDLFVCLETMEHINPDDLDSYLYCVERFMSPDGVGLITVPNETGTLFLFKQAYKRLLLEGGKPYSAREAFWQTLGRVDKVKRSGHKGFSWKNLERVLSRHFNVVAVEGVQIEYLPPAINASVGFIIGK